MTIHDDRHLHTISAVVDTELPMTAEQPTQNPPSFWRFRYRARLATIRAFTEMGLVLLTSLVVYLVVFSAPHQLLGASGGTPRHWILGTVVIGLAVCSIGAGIDRIYADRRPSGIGYASLLPHLLLAALLLWPLGTQLAAAWQSNDPALVPALVPALAKVVLRQLAPALLLQLVHITVAFALGAVERSFEFRAVAKEQEQQEKQRSTNQAEVQPS